MAALHLVITGDIQRYAFFTAPGGRRHFYDAMRGQQGVCGRSLNGSMGMGTDWREAEQIDICRRCLRILLDHYTPHAVRVEVR